jgi:lipopolysaccharide export LptBFGC system permease protein LptF
MDSSLSLGSLVVFISYLASLYGPLYSMFHTWGLAQGSLVCIFYFAADFICRNMGLQGGLDPMLAAWLPVLVFGSLGLVFYDAMRT